MEHDSRRPTELQSRVAIVTGASRGIGLAIAKAIVREGGAVCLTARSAEGLSMAANECGEIDQVLTVSGASDDPSHRAQTVERTVERFGRVDLLVNNAGTNAQFGPLMEATERSISKTLTVNVTAPIEWAAEVWRASMQRNGGVILNIASVAGLRVGRLTGAYNVSKAALVHLTRQLALELAPAVRVNALAAGIVKTQMSRILYEGHEEELSAIHPLRRMGTPEDIAEAALFLLSPRSSWITGETLVIDGGGTSLGSVTEVGPETPAKKF